MRLLYEVPRRSCKSGFTILELLVVISIISMLLALLLPAIQSAREASRRVLCMNNLHNIAVAMIGHAEAQRRFPAAAYWGDGSNKTNPGPHHNWVVQLLPMMDRSDLADRWNFDRLITGSTNVDIASVTISVLICPSDPSTVGSGDLSYVLNGGIGESDYLHGCHDCIVDPFGGLLDLNGNDKVCIGTGIEDGSPSDRDVYKALGLFFNENWGYESTPGYKGTHRFHTFASVFDGLSNTMLLSENVKTGAALGSNWASCDSRRTKVYFSNEVCKSNSCKVNDFDRNLANSKSQGVNGGIHAAEGMAPWPSSGHYGGINVSLADGSVRFVQNDIDGGVYLELFSTQGSVLSRTAFADE